MTLPTIITELMIMERMNMGPMTDTLIMRLKPNLRTRITIPTTATEGQGKSRPTPTPLSIAAPASFRFPTTAVGSADLADLCASPVLCDCTRNRCCQFPLEDGGR